MNGLEKLTKDDILKVMEDFRNPNIEHNIDERTIHYIKINGFEYPRKFLVKEAMKRLDLDDEKFTTQQAKNKLNQLFKDEKIEHIPKYKKGEVKMQNKTQPLNQILYGPPGTGKTYNTISRALEIILEKEPNEEISELLEKNEREKLKLKFDEYKEKGQIEFVTFHQSYGYEEFVEGIKAENDESGNLNYRVEDGIFKKLCEKAEQKESINFEINLEDLDFTKYIKVGDRLKTERGIKFEVIEVTNKNIIIKNSQGTPTPLSRNSILDFIKKQDFTPKPHISYQPKVAEYIFKQLNINNFEKNKSLYKKEKEPLKNYILIIDEINRGNISKIFGELITLIEESKRIGADEEIKVRLPYSNEEFGVPKNLYILGTMNTADRSIALLDTALRRRFEFIEMMPKPELLEGIEVDGIDIKNMLEIINKRIEYLYDRDHMIGHSYFMNLENNPTIEELTNIFKNKIIPLLQEYFYDDFEKIMMVLGKGFINKKEINSNIFDYQVDDYLDEEKFIYEIKENFDFSYFRK